MRRYGRIYILPTRFGFLFVIGAVTMILVGATYQNNLVNLLAFFMLSVIFISMVQTHNNLKDVKVSALEIESGFAGGNYLVTTVLANSSRDQRFNLEAVLRKLEPASVYDNFQPLLQNANLKLRATYPSPKRGKHRHKEVTVSTVYPLGLFRAWAWFEASGEFFIYPEPKGARSFPSVATGDPIAGNLHTRGGDDFHGHRKHEPGESLRHIDWKAHARGRPLLVKQFDDGAPSSIQLDWYSLEGLDTEARLSQLAAWVEEAKMKRLSFGLKLPGLTIPTGHGTAHATHCLEALAVHGHGEVRSVRAS